MSKQLPTQLAGGEIPYTASRQHLCTQCSVFTITARSLSSWLNGKLKKIHTQGKFLWEVVVSFSLPRAARGTRCPRGGIREDLSCKLTLFLPFCAQGSVLTVQHPPGTSVTSQVWKGCRERAHSTQTQPTFPKQWPLMGVEKPHLSPCPSETLGEPTPSPSAASSCRWERFSKENHSVGRWELFRLRDSSPRASSSGIFIFSPPPSPSPSANGQKWILGKKNPGWTQEAQINAQQHLGALLHWTSCPLLPRHAHGVIHKALDRPGESQTPPHHQVISEPITLFL